MPHFKTLATPGPVSTLSAQTYFKQLDMSKHCFAICVLFVLDKLTTHYTQIEDIQQRHQAWGLKESTELSKQDLDYFQINEFKSPLLPIAEFQKNTHLLNHSTATLIVFTANTDKRHSIAIRKNKHTNQISLLNTSGQTGIPRIHTLDIDSLCLYIHSLIESNAAIGNPIQHLQCIRYETFS